MARNVFLWLGVVLAVALSGCNSPPPRPAFPDIRFSGQPPFRLDVRDVAVKYEFVPSDQQPDVELWFPVPPSRALENWVQDRLRAVGTRGHARLVVLDASVKETELPRTQGLQGAFTVDQAERYDAALEARLEILGDRGYVDHAVSTRVSRSRTVPEGLTPNERDRIWYDMTVGLIRDFDESMGQNIQANLRAALQF
jgi:hypothetical protein